MRVILGEYDFDVSWSHKGDSEWVSTCLRCGFKDQTSRNGPHLIANDLDVALQKHVCDPSKRPDGLIR